MCLRRLNKFLKIIFGSPLEEILRHGGEKVEIERIQRSNKFIVVNPVIMRIDGFAYEDCRSIVFVGEHEIVMSRKSERFGFKIGKENLALLPVNMKWRFLAFNALKLDFADPVNDTIKKVIFRSDDESH